MFGTRAVGHLIAGVVGALALGSLATFFRLLPGSSSLTESAVVFGLCVLSVATGYLVGSGGESAETAYW
jgi:hypothetical protein